MATPRSPRTAKITQRFGAAALLLAFLLPLLACVVSAAPIDEASLPACCRTHGMHHCMQAETLSHGTSVSAAGSRCPFCPGTVPPLQHQALSLPHAPGLFGNHAATSALVSRSASRVRLRERDAAATRGPPSLLA